MLKNIIKKTVIAVTTYYKKDDESDIIRANLAIKSIRRALRLGYRVVAVDDNSYDGFLREIEKEGVILESQKEKGMGSSKRQVIKTALSLDDVDCVALTEPEKDSYIKEIWKTAAPILSGKADLVVPGRTLESMATYPLFQQRTELAMCQYLNELTGLNPGFDWNFGPRTIGKNAAPYFTNYDGKYGDTWHILMFPIIDMLKENKKVLRVDTDYIHPKSQTKFEDGNIEFNDKRIKQFVSLTQACRDYWRSK